MADFSKDSVGQYIVVFGNVASDEEGKVQIILVHCVPVTSHWGSALPLIYLISYEHNYPIILFLIIYTSTILQTVELLGG